MLLQLLADGQTLRAVGLDLRGVALVACDVAQPQEREGRPAAVNHIRQIIETVNEQLTEQFQIETNHAQSFWGYVPACTPS